MKLESFSNQFFKFVLVGFISTVINYSFFYVLYKFLFINYLLSSGTGYILRLLAGFVINKKWTFEAKDKARIYIIGYIIVYTLSLVAGILFLKFLVEQLNLLAEIANIFVLILTTLTNFFGIKFLVFKK